MFVKKKVRDLEIGHIIQHEFHRDNLFKITSTPYNKQCGDHLLNVVNCECLITGMILQVNTSGEYLVLNQPRY